MKKLFLVILIISILFLTSCGTSKVRMPDLEGVYLSDAREVISELKLIPAIKFEKSDVEDDGNILRTVPEGGTMLEPYSRVELYVGDWNAK